MPQNLSVFLDIFEFVFCIKMHKNVRKLALFEQTITCFWRKKFLLAEKKLNADHAS